MRLLSLKYIGVLILMQFVAAQAHSSSLVYTKAPGVAGQISSVGSDTLANLLAFWSQEYQQLYPHVQFQIQASGSSTAPPAITEGTANIGPMSRELKPAELQYFVSKHGYKPLMIKVAIDAIALFVAKDNPLQALTLQQVDAIFSVTRYCQAPLAIDSWQQLAVDLRQSDHAIKLYGRNSVSGTYGHFKRMALCSGDFRATVKELPGSASVVQAVASIPGSMGYGAFGHLNANVKALAIGTSQQSLVSVNDQTIASGQYPLTRYLYFLVNKAPNQPLPKQVFEFIRFVLSAQGQELVRKDGYVAVPDKMVERQLRQLSSTNYLK